MNRSILTALVAVIALVLVACNGEPATDDAAQPDAPANGVVEIDVSLQDIEFVPDSVEVPAGATVVFNLTNDGNLDHDLVFDDGTESGIVSPGETVTIEPGPFTGSAVGWCDVPGHREAGMELEVSVAG